MSINRSNELEARAECRKVVIARDKACICSRWSSVPCDGGQEVDEKLPRGRGGNWLNPDECQLLCTTDHQMKTSEMNKGAKIIGLEGEEIQENERHWYFLNNPTHTEADWQHYIDLWKIAWDKEKAYKRGIGPKPEVRYGANL